MPYGSSPTPGQAPGASALPPPMPSDHSMPYGSPSGAPPSPANAPRGLPPPISQQVPQQAYPTQKGIGPNGFGIHPDTTPNDIVDYLLPKFKAVESGGDPKNYPGKKDRLPYNHGDSSASGLYQYTEGTWNNYKGYPRAMDAPPEIQEEKMRADLALSLAKHGNDPYKAIANHYQPGLAHNPAVWNDNIKNADGSDLVYKSGRKPQTVSEYVHSILQAGDNPAGERFNKYIQGANPHRTGGNNQASVQLP